MPPTPAERARGIVATATTVEVGVLSRTVTLERHVADLDGSLLFCAPSVSAGDDGFLSACSVLPGGLPRPVLVATALDVSGVPQPDRVRGVARLTGALEPVSGPLPDGVREHLRADGGDRPVLRLRPQRVAVDWRVDRCEVGAVAVEPAAYARAGLDPLVGWESEWAGHLARDHGDAVDALAR